MGALDGGVDLRAGQRFGQFEVTSYLSRGGVATVYLGRDLELDRQVVIKVLTSQAMKDPEFVARFQREARILARLQHPNVVQVYTASTQGDPKFLVIERLDGVSLDVVLEKRKRLPVELVVEIGLQAVAGLGAAHASQIVHRDVKPDNLVITKQGFVKLIDFGMGRDHSTDSCVTAIGDILGTVHYMPPEQALGIKVDHRSDIYCLGATLYHATTGIPPFGDQPAAVILMKKCDEDPPTVRELQADAPAAFSLLIEKMMASTKEERYQDMATAGQEMRKVKDGLPRQAEPSDLAALVEER